MKKNLLVKKHVNSIDLKLIIINSSESHEVMIIRDFDGILKLWYTRVSQKFAAYIAAVNYLLLSKMRV